MSSIRCIAFDFDGTLVESVGIKDQAFHDLFSVYPEHLDEIMAYHLSHDHTVRFIKFKYIYENILGRDYSSSDKEFLSQQFSELVYRRIVECPMVNGTQDLLDTYLGQVPMYLVSMSPDEELDRILVARGLDGYFAGVYPSSWTKADAVKDILVKESLAASDLLYVGDSPQDESMAQEVGVRFKGRDSGKAMNTQPVKDMSELKKWLGEESLESAIS